MTFLSIRLKPLAVVFQRILSRSKSTNNFTGVLESRFLQNNCESTQNTLGVSKCCLSTTCNLCKTQYDTSDEASSICIDMRSDTVTKPSFEMRSAMAKAKVGDDVMEEDPTIASLQEMTKDLFNMESALFVPTGTMGNLISIMSHCNGRGQEILLGDSSHIFWYEQGGAAQLAGVSPHPLKNNEDGTINLEELEQRIRANDIHYPISKMVCLENTHAFCGGVVLPVDFIKETRRICDAHGLILHMDGARLMNAATHLNCQPADILQHCHSVSVCLSKGLGAPVGSIVAGSKQFIERARRARKALGGGWRQAGLLAACGLVALDKGRARLYEDHSNARLIAQAVADLRNPLFEVKMHLQQTNIVNIYIKSAPGFQKLSAGEFTERCKRVSAEEASLDDVTSLLLFPGGLSSIIRVVTHCDVTTEDAKRAAKKLCYVIQEFTHKLRK